MTTKRKGRFVTQTTKTVIPTCDASLALATVHEILGRDLDPLLDEELMWHEKPVARAKRIKLEHDEYVKDSCTLEGVADVLDDNSMLPADREDIPTVVESLIGGYEDVILQINEAQTDLQMEARDIRAKLRGSK